MKRRDFLRAPIAAAGFVALPAVAALKSPEPPTLPQFVYSFDAPIVSLVSHDGKLYVATGNAIYALAEE